MNAVHVVVFDDIGGNVGNVIADFGQTKIEQTVAVVVKNPVGAFAPNVVRRNTFGSAVGGAVEVEPSVKLNAALVALVNHKIHWVVKRLGCFALFTRKPLRPRLVAFGIKSVGGGPHLHKYGVDAQFFVVIEQRNKLLLLRFRR